MPGSEVNEAAILVVLSSVIAEINDELPHDKQLGTDPSSVIFGENGALDSLDLIRLVVLLEQQLSEEMGLVLSIADERAMSEENSRFRSVGSLVTHVMDLIAEDASTH